MKPTEGVCESTAKIIKNLCDLYGGCWIWICSSKSTDIGVKVKDKKSYIFGAVYVVDVVKTKDFNKIYQKQRLKSQYQFSKDYDYQCIIPSHEHARYELKNPVEVHDAIFEEKRWMGVWQSSHKSLLQYLVQSL